MNLTQNRIVRGGAYGALLIAVGGVAAAGWSAAGAPSQDSPKPVSAFDHAPTVADAATRFASIQRYVPDASSIRFAGRHDGVDWYFARGTESSVCLISQEPDGDNLGMVCTPPGDADPSELRVSMDTSAGTQLSATVVPDGATDFRVRGPGTTSGASANLVVVRQTDDVILQYEEADGSSKEIALPDLVIHHGAQDVPADSAP